MVCLGGTSLFFNYGFCRAGMIFTGFYYGFYRGSVRVLDHGTLQEVLERSMGFTISEFRVY